MFESWEDGGSLSRWFPCLGHWQITCSAWGCKQEQVYSLGIFIDTFWGVFMDMSPVAQLSSVARRALDQFCLVCKLWPFMDKDSLATLFHAVGTLGLDYCNALYVRLPMGVV